MPSFPVSIAILSLLQAALVALPRALPARWAQSLRSPWWAAIPAGSIVVVIGVVEMTPGSAKVLTYLALIACPPLAAVALGWLIRGARPAWALAVIPLFALAWSAKGALAGEASAAAVSALACVTLGWLLASAVPGRWLRWGIYAMATIDAIYVSAEILQGPNGVLVAAHPGALPRLQVIQFGAAQMGFGDVFVAATTGCLLGDRQQAPADRRGPHRRPRPRLRPPLLRLRHPAGDGARSRSRSPWRRDTGERPLRPRRAG